MFSCFTEYISIMFRQIVHYFYDEFLSCDYFKNLIKINKIVFKFKRVLSETVAKRPMFMSTKQINQYSYFFVYTTKRYKIK